MPLIKIMKAMMVTLYLLKHHPQLHQQQPLGIIVLFLLLPQLPIKYLLVHYKKLDIIHNLYLKILLMLM